MHALWFERQELSIRELSTPEPAAGEALIALHLAGICSTDLEVMKGYVPYLGVLGHELVGQVVAAPDAPGWVGKRVVAEINMPCRVCSECLALRANHCPSRQVLGIVGGRGAFAEYLCLPLPNLHEVPDSVTDEQAVFVEPLAAACEIFDQIHIRPSARVLVVGAGRLGQLIAQVVALTGCRLLVVAKHEKQKQLLSQRRIESVDPTLVPPRSMDVVIEASGAPTGFAVARSAVRPRGTLVLKSTFAGSTDVDLSSFVVDEITLVGSRCGPFASALALLGSGLVDPLPLVEARYGLAAGVEAFQYASRPGALKVLLSPADVPGRHRDNQR